MENPDLLELLNSRNEHALRVMAEKYGKRLYRTALNLLGNSRDAEECVNDTYLAVWNAVPPVRPVSLSAYVYRTGRNIAINRLRNSTAQKRNVPEFPLDELSAYLSIPGPEDSVILGQLLNAWLDTQNQRSRIIFLRRYWFGDPVTEIARFMGMRDSAVSTRLHRLRKDLKDYLTREGYYE